MWRSLLFIPALADKFLAKAHQRGADGIILDLEDSIAPARKTDARRALAGAISKLRPHRLDILVRINAGWRLAVRDLEAAVTAGVSTIVVPKAANAGHIKALDEIIGELEIEQGLPGGAIGLFALIETPAALLKVEEIAQASPRMRALTLGAEDFALAMGAEPGPTLLSGPCQAVVIAAKAAGCAALGHPGSIAEFSDLEAFRSAVRLGRELGCEGGSAIHPAQVAVLNEIFTPSAAEIDFARRCVGAYEHALQTGSGAISLDGKMIDIPVYERARNLLLRLDARQQNA